MAKPALNGVLDRLRLLAGIPKCRDLADEALLHSFAQTRDEAAFTVLLERHGPMVLGVCRRALVRREDAEDACQATFLVLARKAGSVRRVASLHSWLHGVARRVSAQFKREQARRARRERSAPQPAAQDTATDISWQEVQAALDDELQQVPERYRAPLILCYLQGKTRDEAAKELGVSSGALHGRLERGRELLRGRLTRRGIALSAALFGTVLGEGAQAALPPTFVVASAKAASLFAAGTTLAEGAIPAQVLTLTQGVLKTMFLTKAKLGTGLILVAAITALIGGAFSSVGSAQDAPKGKDPKAAIIRFTLKKDVSDEDFIRRLSKDLRGKDPSPAEVHFFVTSKEPAKREKLVDLFIKEREETKKRTEAAIELTIEGALREQDTRGRVERFRAVMDLVEGSAVERFGGLQRDFFKELNNAKGKEDVARVTSAYLDRLVKHINSNPKGPDAREVIRQVITIYESQGKTVEAEAWRDRLEKTK
ncbi:MAG: sigma-70 family RNA polymerase sigma factor [Gemmataceae bacterium]